MRDASVSTVTAIAIDVARDPAVIDRRGAVGSGKHDALVEIDEMRRGVDMHALAKGLGHGANESNE